MNLLDFKKKIGFDLTIHIRDNPPEWCNYKFYTFSDIHLDYNNTIVSCSADGNTADETLSNLAKKLSNMKLRYKDEIIIAPDLEYEM